MLRKADKYDSKAVALLHKEGIPSGFLSSLKTDLLAKMYCIIIEDGSCFVYVHYDLVRGFITCSTDSKALYKKIVRKNVLSLIPLFLKKIFSLSFIKRSLESFLIPFKTGKGERKSEKIMPELLSIVISKDIQAKGIGSELLAALENDLKAKNVKRYKVIAGDNLVSANKFYLKNGFAVKEKLELHKGQISNIYVKEL